MFFFIFILTEQFEIWDNKFKKILKGIQKIGTKLKEKQKKIMMCPTN